MALNVTRPSRFKSYGKHAEVDDQRETIYTCPSNSVSYMSLVFVSNGTANASDVLIEWYDASETSRITIVGSKNLAGGEFLQLSSAFLVLEPGDRLEVTPSNTAGGNDPDIGVITTVEEVFLPTQG